MFRQTALVSPPMMPLSEWMPCNELTASAKSESVLFVTVAFSAALPSPASSTMPRSKYWRTWLLLINVVCEPPAPLAPTMMPNASDDPEPTTAGSPITLLVMLPLKVPVPLPLLTLIAPPCRLPRKGTATVPLFETS